MGNNATPSVANIYFLFQFLKRKTELQFFRVKN